MNQEDRPKLFWAIETCPGCGLVDRTLYYFDGDGSVKWICIECGTRWLDNFEDGEDQGEKTPLFQLLEKSVENTKRKSNAKRNRKNTNENHAG